MKFFLSIIFTGFLSLGVAKAEDNPLVLPNVPNKWQVRTIDKEGNKKILKAINENDALDLAQKNRINSNCYVMVNNILGPEHAWERNCKNSNTKWKIKKLSHEESFFKY